MPTPHVPHNWESHVFFEQQSATLFCGALVTQLGNGPAVTDDGLVDAAIAAEELFRQTPLGPAVPATYRRLADLEPRTLAVMHGSSYSGDCPGLSVVCCIWRRRPREAGSPPRSGSAPNRGCSPGSIMGS